MRIAFVVGRFPSISETFILSQIVWLLEAGHDVVIFAARRSTDSLVHPDVARLDLIRRTRFARGFRGGHHTRQLQLGSYLLRQIALGRVPAGAVLRGVERSGLRALPVWTYPRGSADFDAVLAHFGPNGVHAMEMRQAGVIRGPLVTVFHGYDMNATLRSMQRGYARLFEEGERFLPVSTFFRDRLLSWGAPPARTSVHHMGIDPDRFKFSSRQPAGAPLKLVSVARLVRKKGLEYAIQAVAAIGGRVEYTIIGDGPERGKLERLIRERGAGAYIHLLGWRTQDEVAGLLERSHVLVAPSVTTPDGEEEGIPVALMEAMATGLPVISTRHSGIPELVEDGVTGHLVGEGDVSQLAHCIRRLADAPERLSVMGTGGRAVVEREFNNHLLHPRLLELLHAVA